MLICQTSDATIRYSIVMCDHNGLISDLIFFHNDHLS